jgi:signal transduction histidine kinase
MVGHELRTPLNAVIGFSEMMDGEVFGPLGNDRYDAYVDDILASSRHLLGVINDIIDVVKLELRELSLQPDEIAVPKFLETCAAFVRERARRQGIALEVAAAEPLPPLIADPQKARQMLINLLGNALKFTPQGGRVRLTARLEGDQVALAVADTGCGIAPDRIAAVLEPFRQADSSLARSHEGLGLGLPLTRQLAELHGGRLALDSAEGAGTTATVYLPREPALDGA